MTNESAPAVAEICRRLDGLPLAIELAAARIKDAAAQGRCWSGSVAALKLVTGGARNLPERQRTLRGTIEWSYTLLEEGERVLFEGSRCSPGAARSRPIEAVCDAKGELP